MTDRVYPSSKPTTTAATTRLPPPPAAAAAATTKPRQTNRHPYRPNPVTTRRRSRRGCFCLCCFWTILVITLLLLVTAIAGCVLYLLYHPHRPTFSIASLKISEFNLTTTGDDTTRLTSKLNLTIYTKNPNKKITFYYDSIAVTCLSRDTEIASGFFKNEIVSSPSNITIIRSTLASNSVILETETVNRVRSDLKRKLGLPLKIVLDTKVRVKVESVRSKKIGIRIKCEGIHSLIPKGGKSRNASSSSVAATVSAAKCKLDLRIKIWKWTF